MFEGDNFIVFCDLSPEAICLWVSPSTEDCLGYTPDEMIGKVSYTFIYTDVDDTIPRARLNHQEVVLNDLVASQVIGRYRHKNGHPVRAIVVLSICYEFMVLCATLLMEENEPYKHISVHSAAMTRIVEPRNQEFERIQRHHEAFRANHTWDPDGLQPEPRVCLILNRFSRSVAVMYASPSCELILHIDSEEIVGKPFLLFIRADDLASFVEQVDVAKATTAITHMRFWFQSPNWPQEIPCEAMFIGMQDGMVLILRRCRPFVRRRLIGSMELYDSLQPRISSSVESRDSGFGGMKMLSTSGCHGTDGFYMDTGVSKRLPIGSIKRIIELDEEEELKPMMDLHPEESSFVEEIAELSVEEHRHHFREHRLKGDEDDGPLSEANYDLLC
ncbi:hypothetical protein BGX28_007581 [Mortierella sp. GBA30]|nr:hypothetical protein BGX28_007581 [Mortierella sp. GBA30]